MRNTKKPKVIYGEYINILEVSVCLHMIQLFSGFLSHWTNAIDTVASHAPKAKAPQPRETLYIGQPQYEGASTISKQATQLDTQTNASSNFVSNATPPHDDSQTTASGTQMADSNRSTAPQQHIQAQEDIAHVHTPIYDLLAAMPSDIVQTTHFAVKILRSVKTRELQQTWPNTLNNIAIAGVALSWLLNVSTTIISTSIIAYNA